MARKAPDMSGLFAPTDPQPGAAEVPSSARSAPAAEPVDRTLPVGVGLKQSELRELDAIARELGIARNALMRYGLAFFLREYRAGRAEVVIEREEKRRVKMP